MNINVISFEAALSAAKMGSKIARLAFRDTCFIRVKLPEENSESCLPYLQMWKNTRTKDKYGAYVYNVFPVDLSCESIFSDDWYIIG